MARGAVVLMVVIASFAAGMARMADVIGGVAELTVGARVEAQLVAVEGGGRVARFTLGRVFAGVAVGMAILARLVIFIPELAIHAPIHARIPIYLRPAWARGIASVIMTERRF